jgi:hypothetical protein
LTARPLLRALAVPLVAVSLAARCGGEAAEETVHRVSVHDVSFALPSAWRAVDHESSDAELDRFQRDHPRFIEIADILRLEDADRFAAATDRGRVRLLVTVRPVEPGYTLRGHIERNLPQFEAGGEHDIEIQGPHEEIVELDGEQAWRVRWSYAGDNARVRLVQYTIVRDGQVYPFTYSTEDAWEESADTFAASAGSIRFGREG